MLLRKQKDPRSKFARWIQELEGLDYEIQYVRGIDNSQPISYRDLSVESMNKLMTSVSFSTGSFTTYLTVVSWKRFVQDNVLNQLSVP